MKMENFDPFCEIHSFTYESVFRGTILLQPERLHLGIRGIVGVWMAQAVLDWGLRSVFFVSRYRKGGWEKNLAAQAKA